ncbi:hypothetical protein TNCV_2674981 [Trichonephila clavipes]|nr:hypothetical protein TNCV_2674981 [Trichonephila clavipes]
MGTGKCHTGLSLVNREDMEACQCEFWRETFLPIGINVLVHCHADGTIRPSARTEDLYDEWIPSNDVFKKFVASVTCSKVWRRSFRTHSDTNAAFFVICEFEGCPTRSLYSMDSRPSLRRQCHS